MLRKHRGIWIPISLWRRLIIDELYLARQTPTAILARTLNLSTAALARKAARPSPSWTAIFIRAFGLVAQKFPDLRRSWVPLPWPHFYEHPHLVCVMVTERESHGESLLLATRITAPEHKSIVEIDQRIRKLKDAPLTEIADFRRLIRYARLPMPLRRLVAWLHLSWSGYVKANRIGNFMISSVGSLGAEAINPHCFLTSHLSIGPISPSGKVDLNITFDHRVTDGRPIAHALNELENVMNTTIVEELRTLTQSRMAA